MIENNTNLAPVTPNLMLAAPWIIFEREIEALFKDDPEVRLELVEDGSKHQINLYVDNAVKAQALDELLPTERSFGNVAVAINIFPCNSDKVSKEALYRRAFENNPAFKEAVAATGIFTNPITYVVFKPEVVQFYADNLHDINGNTSTLYQEIAKDIFGEDDGVCFCTDKKE